MRITIRVRSGSARPGRTKIVDVAGGDPRILAELRAASGRR